MQFSEEVFFFFSSSEPMQFHKPVRKNGLWTQQETHIDMLQEEQLGQLINVENLPSHARICINVILLADAP